MIIAIPSYRRAQNCKTALLIPKAKVFVHAIEAEEYREHINNDIVEIPNELMKKGMAVIRNFILDNTDDEEVLMLDDDINSFGYLEGNKHQKFDADTFWEFAENAFIMARDAKTTLWGINLQNDRKFYRSYSPFSLSSVVLGPCFGIIKDKDIRFDEELGLKEDYDYALQVLNKHRKILRFNKYHYNVDHITATGGCATYRTYEKELEQAMRFKDKWGDIVEIGRKSQHGNMSINPYVRPPIRGI